jgi:hypothetical protein
LAKTQRHCPMCGAAQDPKRRYFPRPDQEVEVKGHRFVGVDWACTFCESPNSAAAAFCINCGGPKDGAKHVALVSDTPPRADAQGKPAATAAVPPAVPPLAFKTPASPPPQPGTRSELPGFPWFGTILAFLLIVVSVLAFSFFSKHDESVQLGEKSWSRSVDVEQFTSIRGSSWCDALPADAYQVSRTREQRGTREVPDGEVCVDSRTDMGDGTFTKRRECSPRYRDEPVYDSRCSYRINRWQVLRTDRSAGGAQAAPSWPTPLLGNAAVQGDKLGAQRLGTRRETYRVRLQSDGGGAWTCDLPAEVWATLAENQILSIKVRGTGGADCASLVSAK